MTGNTRKLADKIHEILPKESCDYFGTADAQGIESELLYIGFWTDKGCLLYTSPSPRDA